MSAARIRIAALVLIGSLVLSGVVPAATIVGTNRNDTMRGTPHADKLSGKAGDDMLMGSKGDDLLIGGTGADRLLGGPGQDRLVGGAGADRLVCGPGRDVAWADAEDTVAKDCETVRGVRPLLPALGTYCGSTSQGMSICFDLGRTAGTTARSIRRLQLTVQAECDPDHQLARTFGVDTLFASVAGDGTFVVRASVSVFASLLRGAFARDGTSASGTLTLRFTEDMNGVTYTCDTGVVSWQARTPPPLVSAQPGTFCGNSDQGLELCLDVAGTPKTVTNLSLVVRTQCMPEAVLGVRSTIPTSYAIREDGGFAFVRRGVTTNGGDTLTVRHAMTGAFDAAGSSASGTLSAHMSYDAPDGSHYECDSDTVRWAVQRTSSAIRGSSGRESASSRSAEAFYETVTVDPQARASVSSE